jgi:hypothetical protein
VRLAVTVLQPKAWHNPLEVMATVTFRAGVPWNMSDPTFRWAVKSARETMTRLGASVAAVEAAPVGRDNLGRIVFEMEMRPGYQSHHAMELAVLGALKTLRHFKIDVFVDETERAV